MVAIVKPANGKTLKTSAQKKEASPSSDSDSSSSDEEIKIDPKKIAQKTTTAATKRPASDSSEEEESESESEEETKAKPIAKAAVSTKKPAVKKPESESEEEKLIIHPKNGVNSRNNGFNKPGANSKEDEANNKKLQEMTGDVKGDEAKEKGDFKNFDLSPNMTKKLHAKGITYLYPIQIATIKPLRAGHDVIAQARTGTGKTMAFGIPIVEKLEANKPPREISKTPKCLILEPTRELAKQVGDDFDSISTTLKTCCVYGGVSYEKQERELRGGVDVLAGTPGRILDFINSGKIDLNKVEHVILDEVDRMLDMGFQDSVEDILKSVFFEGRVKKAQTLFFSATCPPWVKRTAQKYINEDFKFIDLIGDSKLKTATTVEHLAIQCSYHDRASTIGSILQVYSGKQGRSMIFCETKRDCDDLACCSEIKVESHVMHGDVPQDKREMVLQKFRDGKYRVLITTDVAARGLDIPEVDLVICCNPPKDYESYIHRSGRTGRAGRTGVSICFYKPQEQWGIASLERLTGTKFRRISAPTASEIVDASTTDATKALDGVNPKLIEKFRAGAEEILKTKDAVNALAAALAVISGNTKISNRSLLSSRENMTTYMISKTDEEIRGKSFVYVIMKKILGDDKAEKAIQQIRFTKDKKGLVFDVMSECDDEILEKWFNTKSLEMNIIEELPELEEERGGSGKF
jgi:ATP-dependent RNA helicase DDX21